jgi:hypothetical protein
MAMMEFQIQGLQSGKMRNQWGNGFMIVFSNVEWLLRAVFVVDD